MYIQGCTKSEQCGVHMFSKVSHCISTGLMDDKVCSLIYYFGTGILVISHHLDEAVLNYLNYTTDKVTPEHKI